MNSPIVNSPLGYSPNRGGPKYIAARGKSIKKETDSSQLLYSPWRMENDFKIPTYYLIVAELQREGPKVNWEKDVRITPNLFGHLT